MKQETGIPVWAAQAAIDPVITSYAEELLGRLVDQHTLAKIITWNPGDKSAIPGLSRRELHRLAPHLRELAIDRGTSE